MAIVKDVTFNTGRLYTKEGQVIRATFDGQIVRFSDFSRMVSGEFPYQRHDDTDASFVRLVMTAYDHSIYRYTREAPSRTDAPPQAFLL